MYVIKSGSNDRLHPADRCTWATEIDPTGGYRINVSVVATRATFWSGGDTTGDVIAGAGDATTRPQLGYIGKSGRFVAITNP